MTAQEPFRSGIVPGNNIANLRQFMQRHEGISGQDFDNILLSATEILNRAVLSLRVENSTQGLIYGHIQSGKTAVIITVMALALDNNYRNFVVLTSDLNDLYLQTLNRIRSSLHSFVVYGKQEFGDPNTGVSPVAPLIFVSTKNPTWLPRLSHFIGNLNRDNETFIIVDDEADQASLDTNINNNLPRSTVNREIANLRASFVSSIFLQTTATPQALLLQDQQDAFRPNYVVVTEPGAAYVGGNHFFSNEDFEDSPYLRIVDLIDLETLNNNQLPDSITESLFVFLMGAAILRLEGYTNNYAYLLHTSFRQSDHNQAATQVRRFVTNLMTELMPGGQPSSEIIVGLSIAYRDLQTTFTYPPPLQTVIQEVRESIASTIVSEVNSSTGQGVDPNPSRRHTIYVGGAKIGRGVTIQRLLVTYYGRDAQSPQMDTVLQHARMYGYRQNELPAIRIYLPNHLAQRFYDIHASDNAAREISQATHEPIPVIPVATGMRPTRRNVLNQNTVDQGAYIAGAEYFPRQPISDPNIVNPQTPILDNLLSPSSYPDARRSYCVSIDDLLEILNFRFGIPGSSGAWEDDLIRQSLNVLRNNPRFNNQGSLVIANRESDVGRSNNDLTRAVRPGSVSRNRPYGADPNYPILMMFRLQGTVEKGWQGSPFWLPLLRFPNGNYAFAANYS